MLPRPTHATRIDSLLRSFPTVGLIGARQVGKTTLARSLGETSAGPVTRFDLEDPRDTAALREPMLALEPLRGLVILDEIQRCPELFPVLRVLADRPETPARFLVLGSASPHLLRQSSETLAGRIAYHELGGFDLEEVEPARWETLWVHGGFPRSFLAVNDEEASEWRSQFVRTFPEVELDELGLRLPSPTLRRFWTMLAHYHGQTWNGEELARAFGVSARTVRRYLDLLCATFMARVLPPWFENLGKRQVKAPKVYLSDSGLLHSLLGIDSRRSLLAHPKVGASFEGFAIQQVIRRLRVRDDECFSWGLHTGSKLDLLVVSGERRLGFEMKATDAPRTTRSMHSAIETLRLDRLDVIHAGARTFALGDRIRAVGMVNLLQELEPLRGE